MSLYVDLHPLNAMEGFYGQEELGIWEGEFIKNERERGIVYPPALKEFLQKYGYLSVNRGESRFWQPDDARSVSINVEGEIKDLLITGAVGEFCIGVFAEDCDQEDPPVSFGKTETTPDGRQVMSFADSGLLLSDILICLFSGNAAYAANAKVYAEEEEVEEILGRYGDCEGFTKLEEYIEQSPRPFRFICYSEEDEKFICVDLYRDKEVVQVFSPYLSDKELDSLIRKELYENSLNCDYEHALSLIEKKIDRLEQDNQAASLEAGEKYRLAGRCCWELKQWDKAEEWLKKAEPIFNLKEVPAEMAMSYYQGLGNFYSDKGDEEKSLAAYQKEEQLAKENGISTFRPKGDRLMRRGIELSKQDRLEEAIELFEQALEQYKQDPKGCKYEIARCGQLKGDARHTLKERQKNVGK